MLVKEAICLKKERKILVIGLGVLGDTVARTLAEDGAEVIALDKSPILIDRIKDHVNHAVEGDSTDRKVLEQIGAADLDAAVICIGEEFEGAVLTAAHLIDLEVAHIASRANSEISASILQRLGVHEVFFVEIEMGKAIAHQIHSPSIKKEMEIGDGYRIIQWVAPAWMHEKEVMELAINKRFKVQIIGIKGQSELSKIMAPYGDTLIHEGDMLLLAGQFNDLDELIHREES